MKKGDRVLSKRYPGLWVVDEVDCGLVTMVDARGFKFISSVGDLTPYSREAATGLSANDLGVTTINWLKSLLEFNDPQTYIAMEQAGYTATKLFTDLLTVAVDGVIAGGGDLPAVLQDALFAVAAKRNDIELKELVARLY